MHGVFLCTHTVPKAAVVTSNGDLPSPWKKRQLSGYVMIFRRSYYKNVWWPFILEAQLPQRNSASAKRVSLTYRVAQKVSYRTLSISSLNINQFSHFFTSRLCKKFATHWHAHHTYYVATLPCKTQIFENQQKLAHNRRSYNHRLYDIVHCWFSDIYVLFMSISYIEIRDIE